MEYLHTGKGEPPIQWIEFVLCRDVYHCTPLQLRTVPLSKILQHMACMRIENEVQDVKSRAAAARARRGIRRR